MKKRAKYRIFSGLLSLCLVAGQMAVPQFAVYADTVTSTVCEHHVHDEDCGYSKGTPCNHEHDKECYREVTRCIHEHDEDCYSDDYEDEEYDEEASPSDAKRTPSNAEDYLNCPHICDKDSGCITMRLDCTHEHDDECGYSEGTACSFDPADCEICSKEDLPISPQITLMALEANEAVVTTAKEFGKKLKDDNIGEIHIGENCEISYTSKIDTEKKIVVKTGGKLTITIHKSQPFAVADLVIEEGASLVVNSVSGRAYVSGNIENNGEIIIGDFGTTIWNADTEGSGTFTGKNSTFVRYGCMKPEMFSKTNAAVISVTNDDTNATNVTLDETTLICGTTIQPIVSNLIEGVDPSTVFTVKWTGPYNSTLSNDWSYTIPAWSTDRNIKVSLIVNKGYTILKSSSATKSLDSDWYTVHKMEYTTVYVDSDNGSDTNIGSPTKPFQTLQKALDTVAENGTIYLSEDNDETAIFRKNVTIASANPSDVSTMSGQTYHIQNGCTVKFQDIKFGDTESVFMKGNSAAGEKGSLILERVSGKNLTIQNIKSVTIEDSEVSGDFTPERLTLIDSSLAGKFSCRDLIAKGKVVLLLRDNINNNPFKVKTSITAENPILLDVSKLANGLTNGMKLLEVPSEDAQLAKQFQLSDTAEGRYSLANKRFNNSSYITVIETAVAYGQIYVCSAPKENLPLSTSVRIFDQNKFAITNISWSGMTNGTTWQIGDVPILTAKLISDPYFFTDAFDLTKIGVYDWQDKNQYAENFFDEKYKVETVITDKRVAEDGKSITFTMQFPTIAHRLTKTEYLKPTCTQNGNIAYWTCEDCNRLFSDEAGTKEVTAAEIVIGKLGHDYNEPIYVWNDNGSCCEALFICKHDNLHTVSLKQDTCTSSVKTNAACTEKGVTTYKAVFTLDGKNYEATKDIADIPALGHVFDDGVVTKEPTTSEEGIKTYTCIRGDATKTEIIPKKELERSSSSEDRSSNTSANHWVAEIINGVTVWKLKKANGTFVTGSIKVDSNGQTYEAVAWERVNGAWYAFGADGYAKSGWVKAWDKAGFFWYYIDINSGMKIGWHLDPQDHYWYYLDPQTGKLLTGWNFVDGKWYYLATGSGEQTWIYDTKQAAWVYDNKSGKKPIGSMYQNEKTPDGFKVGADGAWIQ